MAPAVPSSLIPAWRGEGCPEQGCALWVLSHACLGAGPAPPPPSIQRVLRQEAPSWPAPATHTRTHTCAHTHAYICAHTHTPTHKCAHTHTPGVLAGEQPALLQMPGPCTLGPPPCCGAGPHPRSRTRRGCPPTLGCPHRSSPSDAATVTPGQSLTEGCQAILLLVGKRRLREAEELVQGHTAALRAGRTQSPRAPRYWGSSNPRALQVAGDSGLRLRGKRDSPAVVQGSQGVV